MKIFTVWGTRDDPHVMIQGDEPPIFADGTRMPHTRTLHAKFRARDHSHATTVFNALRKEKE